jgi:hypothetical protein
MRGFYRTAVAVMTISLASGPAWAAGASGGDTVGEKLRDLMTDVWNPFFLLIAAVAAITGIWMIAKGLMKLSEAAQERGGKGFAPGLAWIVVGAMLIALPDTAGVGMTSLLGQARGGGTLGSTGLDFKSDTPNTSNFLTSMTGGLASAAPVENCLGSDEPAVCMAKNIATNAVPMGIMVVFSLVFLGGLAGFAMTLIEMAKGTEGRDGGKGHMTRLVTCTLLMNAPVAFGFMASSIFGTGLDNTIGDTGLNSSSSLLSYNGGSTLEIVQHYQKMIGYCFMILAFFGAWAYVRGIFMVKGVAEAGRSAGSYGMAGVYMVAGILMANAKASTCVVLTTAGGSGLAAGFCS